MKRLQSSLVVVAVSLSFHCIAGFRQISGLLKHRTFSHGYSIPLYGSKQYTFDGVDSATDFITEKMIEAAKLAGVKILAGSGAAVLKTKANDKDLVTEVDGQCQKIVDDICNSIPPLTYTTSDSSESGATITSSCRLLGEEDVPPGVEASTKALTNALKECKDDWLWVVDPLDGTTNFCHGLPYSAVSIALVHRNRIVSGVIYDPYIPELYVAKRGKGAFMNGQRISVCDRDAVSDALLAAGSPPNPLSLQPSLRAIDTLAPKVRSVRLLGSAAQMLAYVACGRLTAYFEADLNSWDVAAGAVIVEEAGGMVTGLQPEVRDLLQKHGQRTEPGGLYPVKMEFPVTERTMLATNGYVHAGLLELIHEAGVYGLDDDIKAKNA